MTFYPTCGILKTANAKGKNAVISIDRFEEILGELAEELPAEFYTGLNGGILIEDRHPLHPADRNGDLYIMGEYRNDPSTGRCIVLYYGSFRRVLSLPEDVETDKITATHKDGVLSIEIPRKEPEKPAARKIEVVKGE